MPAAPVSAATVASSMAGSGASLCRSSPICCYCWGSGSWGHLSSGCYHWEGQPPMRRNSATSAAVSSSMTGSRQTSIVAPGRLAPTTVLAQVPT